MQLPRRRFLQLAATGAAAPFYSGLARAQAYPSRAVRILVGFPPGGTPDIAARLIGKALAERLGQPFVIENRAGAATNIATEAVVRAPADDYTLLAAVSSNSVNASLYEKLKFNFIRDIEMVAGVIKSPLVLEVHPSLPVTTVPEFIAYAKANPGKVTLASFGTGTISHVTAELFKMHTGTNMTHVPYKGSGPLVNDLVAGHVLAAFDNLPASIEQIRAGKLRALAVTTATRWESLPVTPTVSDFVPGFESTAWVAIAAPKRTPGEIVARLNSEINSIIAEPGMKSRFGGLGASPFAASPQELGRIVVEETEKWAKVVKSANVKAE